MSAGAEVSNTDPLAPIGARVALHGSSFEPREQDQPSPVGLRPWGLRRARPAGPGRTLPAWSYDPVSQMAVDGAGVPLVDSDVAGDPSADTTASVDGEDPPSSEDWLND